MDFIKIMQMSQLKDILHVTICLQTKAQFLLQFQEAGDSFKKEMREDAKETII